jgi:hypothetical protein
VIGDTTLNITINFSKTERTNFSQTMQNEYLNACTQFYGDKPVNVNLVGYDPVNVPGLHAVSPADDAEFQYINHIRTQVAMSQHREHVDYIGDLARPQIPYSDDPTRFAINGLVVDKIWAQISRNRLERFYNQNSLQRLVNQVCLHDYRCFQLEWGIQNIDVSTDIALLAMYDIVLIGDDSGSMGRTDRGETMDRWSLLKLMVQTISFWATLMDDDGIDVRMFNTNIGGDGDNIRSPQEVNRLFDICRPGGLTPMGESIDRTVKEKKILRNMKNSELPKPVLFLIVTDGVPSNKTAVVEAIKTCRSNAKRSIYGKRAIAFGFCQIGKDTDAQKWLGKIDCDKYIGNSVDCTSEYYAEQQEFEEAGNQLTPGTYIAKVLLGPINSLYDQADEASAASSDSYSPFVSPDYYQMPSFAQPPAPPMVTTNQQYAVSRRPQESLDPQAQWSHNAGGIQYHI